MVDEYVEAFTRLTRYFLELVSTKVKKTCKVKMELRRDVGGRMALERYTRWRMQC